MKTSGIICEYNPFHAGHAYLIEEAKQRADAVICVMSGQFTQRGEAAILDKFVRAKNAILGGADLVLELPMPFSAASARYFATAGVTLLNMVGVDLLVFGSERGDVSLLSELADRSLSEDFLKEKANAQPSEGSAAAHFGALLGDGEKKLYEGDEVLPLALFLLIFPEENKPTFLMCLPCSRHFYYTYLILMTML